jgi:hypothetical protein
VHDAFITACIDSKFDRMGDRPIQNAPYYCWCYLER